MQLAGTKAVNCVALTNVLAKVVDVPLQAKFTVDCETNPVPLTVSVKPAPPAVAEAGMVEVIVAGEGPIVNVAVFDVRPPETTVTVAVPGVATSAPGTEAVNCVKLTKVVASGDPFHSTIAPFAKPLPLTVI